MSMQRLLILIAILTATVLAAFAPAVAIQIVVRAALVLGGIGLAVALRPTPLAT
jgi:hypothetical protein